MRRREAIEFAGAALLAWPLVARAQARALARLGFLGFGTPDAAADRVEALRAGLRDLGYVEDKNLVIEFRWSSKVEQMQEAAAELARMKVDLIFAVLVDRGRAGPTGDQHDPDRLRDGGTLRGAARSRSSSVTSSTGPWEIGRT
jgi:hypothetical protein